MTPLNSSCLHSPAGVFSIVTVNDSLVVHFDNLDAVDRIALSQEKGLTASICENNCPLAASKHHSFKINWRWCPDMHDERNDLGISSNMDNRMEEGERITSVVFEDIGYSCVVRVYQAVERRCGCCHVRLMLALHQLIGDFTPNQENKYCQNSS